MAKGEIAHHEQFHLRPQCFQKSFAAKASESVCIWERVKKKDWLINSVIKLYERYSAWIIYFFAN